MVCDSALGKLEPPCQIDRAELRFIVPLRADTGFAERHLNELGPGALQPLRYVAERERRLPASERTKYCGALRDWKLEDPETGGQRRFWVAYVHSFEEATQVAARATGGSARRAPAVGLRWWPWQPPRPAAATSRTRVTSLPMVAIRETIPFDANPIARCRPPA